MCSVCVVLISGFCIFVTVYPVGDNCVLLAQATRQLMKNYQKVRACMCLQDVLWVNECMCYRHVEVSKDVAVLTVQESVSST